VTGLLGVRNLGDLVVVFVVVLIMIVLLVLAVGCALLSLLARSAREIDDRVEVELGARASMPGRHGRCSR
jgi:ABC-type Na+ efflux pump permease subunit